MMQYSHYTTLPVLYGKSNVYSRFPSLRVMSHTCRGHFVSAKVKDNLICNTESFKVVHKVFLCLFLSQNVPLS